MGYSFHQAKGNVNNQLQISVRHHSVARWRTIKSVPVISDPIHGVIFTLNTSTENIIFNYYGNTICLLLFIMLHYFSRISTSLCPMINNDIVVFNLCSSCDCAAYRPGLRVVPAMGRGGSKLFSLRFSRRGKLLFVHGDVELRSHRRLFSPASLWCIWK